MKNPFVLKKFRSKPFITNSEIHRLGFSDAFTVKKTGGYNDIIKALNIKEIYRPKQVHSDKIVVLTAANKRTITKKKADAIITQEQDCAIGVKVADCIACVVIDPENRVIAAVHSGWRGVENGIAVKTIKLMKKKYGSNPSKLIVSMSPSIGPCCYEIGTGLFNKLKRRKVFSNIFIKRGKKVFMDIRKGNRNMLVKAGIRKQNLFINDTCTMCAPAGFYSYRREGNKAGRHYYVVVNRERETGNRRSKLSR